MGTAPSAKNTSVRKKCTAACAARGCHGRMIPMQNTEKIRDPTTDAGINEDIQHTVSHVLSHELYEGQKFSAKAAKILTIVLFLLACLSLIFWWYAQLDPNAVVTDVFLKNKKVYIFNSCQLASTNEMRCVEHFFSNQVVILTLRNTAISVLSITNLTIGACVYDKPIELSPREMTTAVIRCPGLSRHEQIAVNLVNPSTGLVTTRSGTLKSSLDITGLYRMIDASILWSRNFIHKIISPYAL